MNLQEAITIHKENKKMWLAINNQGMAKLKESILNGATLHTCPIIDRRSGDNFMQDSPLHIAARQGWDEAIIFLIEHGADPNTPNRINQYPIHWAAYCGHLHTIKLLMELGAELLPRDDDHETPLTWATNQGHIDVVDFILKHEIDINEQNDKDGYTALHWAAREGKTKMVRHLVACGADPLIKNFHNLTAQDLAMIYGKFVTAKALKSIVEHDNTY